MSKRKYSAIWLHFVDEDGQRARCNHCKASLSFSGGCHGNLKRHLKLKHPLMPLNVGREVLTSREEIKVEAIDELPLDEPIDELPSTSTQIATVTQQRQETEYLIRTSPIFEVEQIDRQVLKMLTKGHHSFRLVEEPEFIKLINEVSNCPGYKLPSKSVLSNRLLPRIYTELLEEIKDKMHSATAVCLTTDEWTSKTNVSYLAVTAYYINTDTVLTSHLLSCGEFKNKQTSKNVYNFLKKVITDFNINNKVTAIVSNNASNIVAAIRQGEWQGISCFAHSLNTIVQAANAEIRDTINKVKKIVDYFQKNSNALKKLQTAQKIMNLPELKLKQDVSSRWNSTFEMLHRIIQIRDAVKSTLSLDNPDLLLAAEDWEILEETIPILMPLYEVTTEISREKHVALSKVTVICNLLESYIFKCLPLNEKVTAMVTSLQSGLSSRFGNLEKGNLYAESTILDPRFKWRGFKNNDSYEQALRILRNRICTIKLPKLEEVTSTTPSLITECKSIWDAYDLEFNITFRPDNNAAACMREFDNYINEELIDREDDPILWWKEKKHIYPRLHSYALKRLCIAATSVPCERIFTATGQMINERRAFSKPNKVGRLVFLYNNM